MKTFKTSKICLIIFLSIIITSCSTDSDNDPNNNPPGLFSANAFDASVDGASVDWTESIDTDEDTVTYAIFLEGEQVTSGLTKGQVYTFSGLEPETIYAGYVEARDGRGGASIAEFSFVTEPEVIIFNVNASSWFYRQTPEGAGLRTAFRAGFRVPYYENAKSYQIEILDYGFGNTMIGNDEIGKAHIWTNESKPIYIGAVFENQIEPGEYAVAFNSAASNTLGPNYDDLVSIYESVYGEARVTVIISKD